TSVSVSIDSSRELRADCSPKSLGRVCVAGCRFEASVSVREPVWPPRCWLVLSLCDSEFGDVLDGDVLDVGERPPFGADDGSEPACRESRFWGPSWESRRGACPAASADREPPRSAASPSPLADAS